MGQFDKLYAKLPLWGQNLAVSAYGLYWYWLRFGPGYQKAVNAYRHREQTFGVTEWADYQNRMVKDLLKTAVDHVSYYRNRWSLSEKKAALAGQLQDLPLLEKDPLRENPKAFLREDVRPGKELIFHTSGSTGTPIACYFTVSELRETLALREVRSAGWAGVSFKMPRATFSGRIVEPDPNSNGPFYRFNAVEKQVYFSAFHLRPDTAHRYVEALKKHRVEWLTGYAVSYYLLAKFILEKQIEVPPLKAVITTSEKVTPQMRQVMEQAYGCHVFEEYSTVENVIFASEDRHGRLLCSPDVAVVEILRPDGTACDPGEIGEVVATCISYSYQSLIRYRLGDLAAWQTDSAPESLPMPILKEVTGRIEDVVIAPDGRQMVRFHGIFIDQPHVMEGQIIQEELDLIRCKVVTTPDFNQTDIDEIIQRIQQRLTDRVRVIVEPVEHIPRTKSGKFKAVISKLNTTLITSESL